MKVYPNGLQAVTKNTFGVRKGQILGVVGPNGAGKTSLVKMLSMEVSITGEGEALLMN